MFGLFESDHFSLSAKRDQIFTKLEIGENKYPLLVVDNFYKNPDAVAQAAHKLDFSDPYGKHVNALASLAGNTASIDRFVFKYFAQELGVNRVQDMRAASDQHRFYRSVLSGNDLPTRREDPHSDGVFFIAGVLYLTPDKYCKGGTGFYRYRATGAEEKPPFPLWFNEKNVPNSVVSALGKYDVYRAYRESGYSSYKEFLKCIPFKTQGNRYHLHDSNEHWELRQLVPMKYNRLILYPAFVLHKAIYEEGDFDGPPEQRRLTENLFFKYPINS